MFICFKHDTKNITLFASISESCNQQITNNISCFIFYVIKRSFIFFPPRIMLTLQNDIFIVENEYQQITYYFITCFMYQNIATSVNTHRNS
jgi:hypothetical protein